MLDVCSESPILVNKRVDFKATSILQMTETVHSGVFEKSR